MRLNETLHNSLIAIANRYPEYIVDIDEDVWGNQHVKLHAQTPLELVEELQARAPELLQASAFVVCDTYRCELRLLDLSEEKPAILFHFPYVLTTGPSQISVSPA
jgi:hypothetical protein